VAVDVEWEKYYRARYGDPFSEAESLVLDSDLRIREIGDPSPRHNTIHGQYIGLIRLSDKGSDLFRTHYRQFAATFHNKEWIRKRQFSKAHMTDFLQALIDSGVQVHAVPIRGGWLEFDSPSDFQKVQAWHASGILDAFCRLQ
jgi:choline kinase